MELENIKQLWEQYDKKLEKNLRLNEEILRRMNLEQAKKQFRSAYILDSFSLLIMLPITLYLLHIVILNSAEIKFLVPGIIAILFTAAFCVFYYKKLTLLAKVRNVEKSIMDLQKDIVLFEKFYRLCKKIEVISGPIYVISLLPIFGIAVDLDYYTSPYLFLFCITIALIIGYSLTFWIYKNVYEKKINKANEYLKELEEFEKE